MGQKQTKEEALSKAAKIQMIAALIGMMMFLVNEADAAPTKCHATPPQGGYVSWRMVDGRKCFYLGKARIDKGQLYWEDVKPLEVEEEKPTSAPAIRAQSDFEDRWEGLTNRENMLEPTPMENWR